MDYEAHHCPLSIGLMFWRWIPSGTPQPTDLFDMMEPEGIYPVVNDHIAGWKIPIFNGKYMFNPGPLSSQLC